MITLFKKNLGENFEKIPLNIGFSPPEGEFVKNVGDFALLKGKEHMLYYKNSLTKEEEKIAEEAKGYIIAKIAQEKNEINKEIAKKIALEVTKNEKISNIVAIDTFGLSCIELLAKEGIEEIELNSIDENIYVYHSLLGRCKTNVYFKSLQSAKRVINSMLKENEKELNDFSPVVDSQLSNFRIHAQISPLATNGIVFSIRVLSTIKPEPKNLVKNGMSKEALAYLSLAIDSKLNIVIAGPPASGKTTLLNALLSFIKNEKIVCVEEEINEIKKNGDYSFLSLQSRKDKQKELIDQIINSLRLRPQRLVVGEIRGKEAKEVFSAASLGIPFITTLHANDEKGAIINRLSSKPMEVDKNLIRLLDVGVYLNEKRRICRIEEYNSKIEEVNPENISINSKVIKAYSSRFKLGRKFAIKEMYRRAKELGKNV
ncbi:MAG: ATPase, T2SS/T4P/T4SS family [Candidatus Micrarchaeia archaeon]